MYKLGNFSKYVAICSFESFLLLISKESLHADAAWFEKLSCHVKIKTETVTSWIVIYKK